MALYNARGNIRVTSTETSRFGIYAADGAMRITIVDGTTFTGLFAADGSWNVVQVSETDTPVSLYHPCGALRGVSAVAQTGAIAPNGALYMDGLYTSAASTLLSTWADSNGGLAADFTDINSTTPYGSMKIIDGVTPANDWETSSSLTPFDKLTWTGASLRMCYGSDGVLKYAPHNLFTYSQSHATAGWTGMTKTNNTITAPDGTLTGGTAEANATGAFASYMRQTVTLNPGTYTYYQRLKYDNCQWVFMFGEVVFDAYAWFDLTNGVVGNVDSGVSASITALADGWYLCAITFTKTSATAGELIGLACVNGNGSYTATSGQKVSIWGSDLKALPVHSTDYIATTSAAVYRPRIDYNPSTLAVRGLLVEEQRSNNWLWSEDFSNAATTKTNVTVTANSASSPAGTTTADTLAATAGNGTAAQAIATSAVAMTFSVFLKRKTGTGNIDITADGSTWVTQAIDSTNWTRCIVTQTASAGTTSPGIRIVTSGDEVYAWGAQYE